jgi:outer membrane immunogenic protein
MRNLLALSIAGLAGVLPVAAHAADAIALPTSTQAALPVGNQAAGFDWTGFYAGVYGVGQNSPVGGLQYGVGLALGGNVAFDFYLVGAEVAFQGLTGGAGATSYVEALGRAGVLVSDNLAAYATAGYGFDLGAPAEDDVLLGGGLEFAVSDNLSVRAQYLHGFPLTGANPKDQVSLGANFHF